jgi:YHS domain-containing protein
MRKAILLALVCSALSAVSYAEESAATAEPAKVCPVMGGEAVKDYSAEYEGKVYYFCCPSCIDAFKKDPKKYIAAEGASNTTLQGK